MIFDTQLLAEIQQQEQGGELLLNAVKNVLKNIGVTKISIKGSIPKKGKTLIISNHPGVLDTLLLFSEVERDDFHFIALSTYGVFGKAVQKHLLPIYRKRKLNHRIYEYPLSLQMVGKTPKELKSQEVRQKNKETISKAAQLLNANMAVSVFPTGSVGSSLPKSKWKAGVGYLIDQSYDPNMKIIFTKISGTRKSDLVAYLKPFLRKLLFKPRQITISFSKTYTLGELIKKGTSPKSITIELEKKYNQVWKNTL